ncbi:MAG: efflux RND transporter permease subunit [Sandaracinus sp.]|nr:efflux RND transporter permease subunit [Sandaracinus sp.]
MSDDPERGLAAFAVRRGVTTAMVALALVGFGAFALSGLPVNRLPEVELPVVAVVTTYEGASPEDMETLVTEPVEQAVASVENVETIRSQSRQGASLVLLGFTWGTDMGQAEIEVRKNLDIFTNELLPGDATKPLTFAFDPSLAPVMFLSIEGPLDGHQLRRIARERVQPYLARLDGVAAAEVVGGLDRQIQVLLRPRQLQALGVAPAQVVDALRAANVVVPSGNLDDGVQALNLQPTGLVTSLREIEETVVAVRGGRSVLVRDVAQVVDGFEDETHVVTANGQNAVLLLVRKQSDANTVQTARTVAQALPGIAETLPEGVSLTRLFDESDSVIRAVKNLGLTALQAFALTGLVLLFFLRSWRTSLVAVIAVPTSLLVSFSLLSWLNVTLNLISMAGLALAIGMLVDNGIVVLEAAFQELERGASARMAALRGAREMTLPLFASTLTTCVVFLPILLVEGIAGELFRDLVLAITITLLASLGVAITVVPLLVSRALGGEVHRARARKERWIDRLPSRYEAALGWALQRPRRVLGLSALLFVGSLALVPILGKDFLPKSDVGEIRLELTAAPGTSIERMRAAVDEVETLLHDAVPEATVITADYGASEGFAALFGATANRGTMRIKLPPVAERDRHQKVIEEAIAARLRDEVAGLDVRISGFSLSGSSGDVSVKLFDDDLDELRTWGERLRDELGGLDGVREARFSMMQGSPQLALDYDRERMRLLGISPAQVASAVAIFYQGETATFYREDGDEHLVRVRMPRELRGDLDLLRYLPIPLPQPEGASGLAGLTQGSTFLPLSAVATVRDRLGPTDIEREGQRRYATVDLAVGGSDLGSVVERVEAHLRQTPTPESLRTEIGGSAEDLKKGFESIAFAFLAAILLVYMVMASQFESLLEPFVIMFTVPLASIGVMLALLITGTTLQVTALVGVVLLAGIVVNNGIVLVDVLKRRRHEGSSLDEAALEAGRTRLRPILMTSLTTILGMLPLAIGIGDGAETWAPMARAIIGGMVASTLLTLFVIPTTYVGLRRRLDARAARRAERRAPSGAADAAE